MGKLKKSHQVALLLKRLIKVVITFTASRMVWVAKEQDNVKMTIGISVFVKDKRLVGQTCSDLVQKLPFLGSSPNLHGASDYI